MNTEAITVKPATTASDLADNIATALEDAGKAQEKREKKAAAERARRAAKKLAEQPVENAEQPTPVEPPKAEYAIVQIEGESYQVSASLTPEQQHKAARALHDAKADRANGDANGEAKDSPPKPARMARSASSKLPEGHVKFPLSTSAYSVLVTSELDAKIIKALKASDKIRSATKAKNLPYHFPVMTREQTSECADVLSATAKKWAKLDSKDRPGNLASIQRYAVALREVAKA